MQFKIKKDLIGGRYYVDVSLTEYTETDKARAAKFGIPILALRINTGQMMNVKITELDAYSNFGFYNMTEAEEYTAKLKEQLAAIKSKWENFSDSWSGEEVI